MERRCALESECAVLIVQRNFSHLAHRIDTLAAHPGLFCWYLFDEPGHPHQYVSARQLTECADFIRALDPYHPVVVSTGGDYPYRRSWDTHWTQAYLDPAGVVREVEKQRASLKNESPITVLLSCNDWEQGDALRRFGTKPVPEKFSRDYDHFRACAFLSFVKGGNGAIWWWFAPDSQEAYYSASQCPPAWTNFVKVVKELGAVRPLVTMPGEVETGTALDGDAKVEWWRKTVKGRGVYLVAVNTGNRPATVTIGDRKLTFRRHEVKLVKSEK